MGKGWEPLSPEQVTRVESLSPELRGQLKALLLQRPQHPIQTTGASPCWGETSHPEPRTRTLGWEGPRSPLYFPDQGWPGLYSDLNPGVRSGRSREGRRMEEPESQQPELCEGRYLVDAGETTQWFNLHSHGGRQHPHYPHSSAEKTEEQREKVGSSFHNLAKLGREPWGVSPQSLCS